ncbi:MAG: hypothetical protein JSV40_09695 [Deltaproteobacteria bacterium]|nr:MAG: hypothetical protein JSV40_09695 [Deltaproteobacteria bacterium]
MSFLTQILLTGKTMKSFLERLAGGRSSFRGLGMGETAALSLEGNAEGARLPRKQAAEKTSP